ncbi:unnamed protein product [Trypanosoma congolense IL3000]|uniref:WGS project CAEQ00000000 data, annotated contig 198 n=1 Tax=Trypanosoma congolense (strain IL3000) TaxID=1068625 RepID=F9WAK5_TRYCI|nr:unnamed protein product [Trypanosoma congolense IL3000]
MRDTFSTALQLLSRTPGWRRDVSKGNNIVSNWLHLRNDVLCGKLPSVGSVVSCDGRGILFSGGRVDKLEVLDDMQKLSAVRTGRRDPVQDYDTMHQGAFIDDVDAVICATGYNLRYPFLHDDLRSDLEDPPCLLPQGTQQHNDAPESTTTKPLNHRGLYLGTLYVRNPSIGFVGMQQGLLPPFLLMEAQSKFVSYAFTHRLSLPPDTAGLLSRQDDLVQRYPFLANLYSPHGLGLYSSVYFNVLQEELQVGSRDTYTSAIMERQKWILLTSLLRLVHKVRSMAPLKRKRQHILFSNAV